MQPLDAATCHAHACIFMDAGNEGTSLYWAALQAATEAVRAGDESAIHTAAEAAYEHMLTGMDPEAAQRWCVMWNALAVRTGNDPDAERWLRTLERWQAIKALFGIDEKAEAEAIRALQRQLYPAPDELN